MTEYTGEVTSPLMYFAHSAGRKNHTYMREVFQSAKAWGRFFPVDHRGAGAAAVDEECGIACVDHEDDVGVLVGGDHLIV